MGMPFLLVVEGVSFALLFAGDDVALLTAGSAAEERAAEGAVELFAAALDAESDCAVPFVVLLSASSRLQVPGARLGER